MFLGIYPAVRSETRANAEQSKKRTAFLNGLVFVAAFIFIRPFITLVYVFVEHNKAVKSEVRPGSGYGTVETWACALSSGGKSPTAKTLCSELYDARVILIPVLVLSCVQLVLMVRFRVIGFKREHVEGRSSISGTSSSVKGAGFDA